MRYFTHALAALPLWLFLVTAFLPQQSAFAQVSIVCPGNINQGNDPGLCGAVVTYTPPVGTGTGTNITTTLTAGFPSGEFFPVGVTLIEYTVSNDEGQNASCSFFVTVTDTEEPVFDCPPDITVNAVAGTCSAVANFDLPTATDNCGVIEVIQIGGLPSGSSFPAGENVVDFEAYDSEGNSDFCRFRIFVIDLAAPTITCPPDINVNVSTNCSAVVTYTAPVGTDDCTIANTVLTAGLPSGSTFPLGTTVNTYTVTDVAGNTASCSFNVNVIDAAPPVITCPADIVLAAAPGACDAIASFTTPVATDNCPGVSVSQTGGLASGSAFPAGVSTVTYTATDGSGNTANCSFTVTVTEGVPPTISCPADVIAVADPGECGAIVNYTPPVGTDNCDGASTSLTSGLGSGGFFPLGTTTETYTVTDASGNTADCSFDVTVTDGEDPVIDCPVTLTFIADPGLCEALVTFSAPNFTDNCPGASITQTSGPVSGSLFPVGSTSVEFTAEDAAGNTSVCTFDIEVVDEEAPSITCPANISVTAGGLGCALIVNYPNPSVTDNCPGVSFTQTEGPASGELLTVGSYTVAFEAIDAAGNTNTCSFTITVSETNVPVFDCPANLNVSTDPGSCDAVVTFPLPDATDPCTDVTVTQTGGPVSGSTFPIGATTLEFTAEDEFGNTSTCSYDVIVTDNESPLFDCPSDITVPNDPGLCEAVVSFAAPTVTDNCDGALVPTQTAGPASGSVFPLGSTTITYEATDSEGNLSSCSFDIIVEDAELPVITCPADIALLIPTGDCDIVLTYALPTVTDNCPGVTVALTSGPASGTLVEGGIYDITFEATDAGGNIVPCTFQAVVSEETPPVFDCPADIVAVSDPGTCETVVTFDPPTASDDCTDVTVTQTGGPASGSAFPVGSTLIEFTATDASGNTAICTFNIIVSDQDDPVIDCPANIAIGNDPGVCGAVVNYSLPTGTDDCGPVVVQLISGLGTGAFFPVGTQTETYEITDESGNTVSCSFDVVVSDTEAPVLTCPADIVINNIPDGDCDAVVTFTAPTATDNCVNVTITQTGGLASGDAFPVGVTDITFEATDDAGNTVECTFTATVTENVAPDITCPGDITVNNDPSTCGAVVDYVAPVGTDNCGNATTILTAGLGSGATFPVGTTTETYTVTDLSGNETTCNFTITVADAEAPVINCPADIELPADPGTCEATVTFDLPTVTDNCDAVIVPVQTTGPASGTAFPAGITVVTFEATDLAGNISTCSFNVTITDDVPPVITCPADIAIVAADGDCDAVVTFADATATDNCGVPTVMQTDGLPSGSTFPAGVSTITFEATDNDGNVASCSFTVTVTEAVPPTITCPTDIDLENDPGACGAIATYDLPVGSDDCGDVTITLIDGLASGELFPIGTTTVTYQVEDLSGNTAQCSFNVTVADTEAPLVDCPTEISLPTDAGTCGAIYNFDLPTATDNCPGAVAVVQTSGPASGTLLSPGTTSFEFTATDAAGNTTICTYNVVVVDDEAPVFISCPENITVPVQDGTCAEFVSWDPPTVSDNCESAITQTQGPASGDLLNPGIYTVAYTAVDLAGNSAECTFEITVIDDQTPVLVSCPEPISTCDAIVSFEEPTATDNCSDVAVILTEGLPSGSQFPTGITTVSFELSDASGNSVTCTFEVEVLEPATRPDAGADQNICDETSTTLTGTAPSFGTGMWSQIGGAGTIAEPGSPETLVSDLNPGANTFVWSIDPENGCEVLSDTVVVIVETDAALDAGSDQLVLSGGSVGLQATGTPPGGDIIWSPAESLSCEDCLNPVASPEETTTYFATYTTPLGCVRIDSVIVRVTREFPNTITPNGDGVNDVWNIPGLQDYPNVDVVIYNRWGNEVFKSTGYQVPWDGTNKGEDLPTGAYYYIVDYNTSGIENVNGTVNIIR